MIHDAVLEEDVVGSEGEGPGRGCGGQERHWDREADFGRHCGGCGCVGCEDGRGEMIEREVTLEVGKLGGALSGSPRW